MSDKKNKKLSIGFIGGGRITGIFLDGWQKNKALPESIVISDSNPDVLSKIKGKYPAIETTADNKKAAGCDMVFLSLHPPAIATVMIDIKGVLQPDTILVSLAPKWTIAKLTASLEGFNRIVRMIPNAPSMIGEGYNPVAFSSAIKDDLKKDILHLFKALGECPEVEEEKLEAYAILCAMGPTYLWFQMQKLRELGASFGLTSKETDRALYEMVKGAAKTLFKSGLSYDEVVNLVPVKPLGDEEQGIRQIFETRLTGLYQKLKG